MEEKYKEIFSIEERRVLETFYATGLDLIKRTEEGDLIIGIVSSNPEEGLIRRIDGHIIPEEWFLDRIIHAEVWVTDTIPQQTCRLCGGGARAY